MSETSAVIDTAEISEATRVRSQVLSAARNVTPQLILETAKAEAARTRKPLDIEAVTENMQVLSACFGVDGRIDSKKVIPVGSPMVRAMLQEGMRALEVVCNDALSPERAIVELEDTQQLQLGPGAIQALQLYTEKWDVEEKGHRDEAARRERNKAALIAAKASEPMAREDFPLARTVDREDDPETQRRSETAARSAMMEVLAGVYGRPVAGSLEFDELYHNLTVAADRFNGRPGEHGDYVGRFADALEEATLTLDMGMQEQLLPDEMMAVTEQIVQLTAKEGFVGPAIYTAARAYVNAMNDSHPEK